MRKIELQDLTPSLETGYAAIPFQLSQPQPPLNLCVVVRANPDPASGHFVLIRRSPLADVFLGCIADHAGRPADWLEIWVQNLASGDHVHPAFRKNLTNAALERRWRELAAELRDLDPDAYYSTPFETVPPPPIWIDKSTGAPVHPKDAQTGQIWVLCTDDAVLEKAGLPSYSRSLARYLFLPAADEAGHFIPVTPGAPTSPRTVDLSQALPEASRLPAFNVAGAQMLCRRYSPLGLDEFTEVLGGKAWHGIENARKAFHPGGVYRLLEDEDFLRCGAAHLFSASAGRSGRFAETLHLKLQMILQATRLVREAVQTSQLPLLNLGADSFRVSLGATGLGLPFLWTQKLALCAPGVAFPLPISNSNERYFQTAEPLPASIYRPAELAIPKSGLGSVRIRKVVPGPEGAVLEGTLSSHERIGVDESELIWIQLPSSDGKTDLYGFRDTSQAMAVGEAFFRTIPQKLSDSALASLQAVAGVPFNQVPFSILPPLSSPCDLYSLGVLAARILLVNPRNDLPQALDSVLSLTRQLASSFDPAVTIGERVRKVVEADQRWVETLGPQHLRIEEASAGEASAGIPARLWWDLLGLVARFFPGTGPDSFCKGFGDAPALALHAVFDKPLDELNALAIRSRALVTLEWRQNVEIAALIAEAEQRTG
jgi:hypothetical protein